MAGEALDDLLTWARHFRDADYNDGVSVLATQGSSIDLAYLRAHAGVYRVSDLLERAVKEAEAAEP